jgi:hypothetical protein
MLMTLPVESADGVRNPIMARAATWVVTSIARVPRAKASPESVGSMSSRAEKRSIPA